MITFNVGSLVGNSVCLPTFLDKGPRSVHVGLIQSIIRGGPPQLQRGVGGVDGGSEALLAGEEGKAPHRLVAADQHSVYLLRLHVGKLKQYYIR